jgi:uncharacterized protein (TIGR02300 family)
VAKPELGTKRLCGSCAAKFYDLGKTPITCPKCHTVMELAALTPRSRPDTAASRAPAVKEEASVPETQDAEFVSLEEADAEAEGKKAGDADAIPGDDDIEIDDEPIDDAALIEEQEESDDDVSDIIGEREDNEEEP